jgi:hypothetical protein
MKIKLAFVTLLSTFLLGFTQFKNNTTAIPLEAILVVGNTQESTPSTIKEMNKLALIFQNNGIKVTKFYNRNTNWEAIKTAAKTASFFVYSGHGSTMGINGKAGGLCLNKMISTKQILEELQLKKNAIVLFKSVCGGAGSSADDSKDIGIEEATTRVTDYAQPFFTIGASCYYADNYEGGIDKFIVSFLAGNSIEECYEATTNPDYIHREISKPFDLDKKKMISICSDKNDGLTTQYQFINGKTVIKKIPSFKNYDIACVANPCFTIHELVEK